MAASAARASLVRFGAPAFAAGCFGYAGYTAWELWQGGQKGEDAELRARWDRDAQELDSRRQAWVQGALQAGGAAPRPLFVAEVIAEVHNMAALGPAGVLLKRGDMVDVLAEGTGMEQGFHIVRNASGSTGIYPKQYLRRPGAPPAPLSHAPALAPPPVSE